MDRNFSETEINELIRICLKVHDNVLPYLCKENFDCRYSIERSFCTVKSYNLVPELYWHGSKSEFEALLILLGAGYPSVQELLALAKTKTKNGIEHISHCYFQHIDAMFDFVTRHHGYVALRPTEFMTGLYPNSRGKLYVYTADKWNHSETSGIDNVFMTLDENRLDNLGTLIHEKIYGY